jgi:hypothetical protein
MTNRIELPVVDVAKADLQGIGVALKLPDSSGRPPDVENQIIRFFGKLGVIEAPGGVEFGMCAYEHRDFVVEGLEQHRRSGELLYAIDDDFLMPVAPNLPNLNQPDLSKAFAIRVRRSEGVIFAPGAWHWVPYPIKRGKSFALVGFAIDTPKNDMFSQALSPPLKMRA